MKKSECLNELAKLLVVEVSLLTDDFLLKNHQLWDSLSMISVIALIDQQYQVTVSGEEVDKCNTIGDLFNLIKRKTDYEH